MAGGQLNQVASMLAGSQGMQTPQSPMQSPRAPQTPMQGFNPQAMSGLARLMGQGPGVQRNTFQPKTYQPQYQANFTQAIQARQAEMNPVLAALYGGGSQGPAAAHGALSGNSLSGNFNPGFSGTQYAAPVYDGEGNMMSSGHQAFGSFRSGDPYSNPNHYGGDSGE